MDNLILSYSNLYTQFSLSFILNMTIKLQNLSAEKDPRCHFRDEKNEIYNGLDL